MVSKFRGIKQLFGCPELCMVDTAAFATALPSGEVLMEHLVVDDALNTDAWDTRLV